MTNLKIEVAYYDDDQKKLFQGFPNADALNQIVRNGVSISKDEFLAYMMFTWQMDVNGFRTYNDLRALVQNNLGAVNKLLSFNNDSVQARVIGNDLMQTGFTERIGVSLGLCLLNKIHNLTAADWKKIPTVSGRNGHPTFDFDIPIASTGNNFIQCENKGSAVINNWEKPHTVEDHYKSIIKKKKYVRSEELIRNIPLHQNLYYGTIGVLDNRPMSTAKIWLVDPPAFDIEMDPKKYKLLARLSYYLNEFRTIGVKKKIINSLEERIKEIDSSKDFMELNLKKLDDSFPGRGTSYLYMEGKEFTSIDTNEGFGKTFFIERNGSNEAFLIAYSKSIMRLIVKQDFEAIIAYFYDSDFMKENVQVNIKTARLELIPNKKQGKIKFKFNERNMLYEAIYFGKISYTSAGKIFGILKF